MANSHENGVRLDTSSPLDPTTFLTHPENRDADLDLVQCSSPSSANADHSLLQGARNPNSPIHPSSPVDSHSPIPDTGASEHQQEMSVSPQNNHLVRAAMHTSGDLRKTALTNSQHHASGTIVTRNRHGRLLTLDLTPAMNTCPDVAEDLYDWLELTGWHDVARRIREVNRHRELEALEKQQASIQSKKEQLLRSYEQENAGPGGYSKTTETSSIVSGTYNSPSAQHLHGHDMFQDVTVTEADQDTRTGRDSLHYAKGLKQEDEHIAPSKLPGTSSSQLSLTRSGRDRSASPNSFRKNDQYDYTAYRTRKAETSRARAEERNQHISAPSGPSRQSFETRITARPGAHDNGRLPHVSAEHRQYPEAPEGWDRDRRRDRDDLPPLRDLERERMNIGYYRPINLGQPGGKYTPKSNQHEEKKEP
ncbi:hypothetical protein F4775DRAFT_385781 [Biscogniauxia sp. FL1348]|nr:hypothetical protein F4775DRAFT_385781 [Biscogniauxia sp. FL1348]